MLNSRKWSVRTDHEIEYFHDWNFIVRVTLVTRLSIRLGFNNDPSNTTAGSSADFELKFQPGALYDCQN